MSIAAWEDGSAIHSIAKQKFGFALPAIGSTFSFPETGQNTSKKRRTSCSINLKSR